MTAMILRYRELVNNTTSLSCRRGLAILGWNISIFLFLFKQKSRTPAKRAISSGAIDLSQSIGKLIIFYIHYNYGYALHRFHLLPWVHVILLY